MHESGMHELLGFEPLERGRNSVASRVEDGGSGVVPGCQLKMKLLGTVKLFNSV